MSTSHTAFEKRKKEHLKLALDPANHATEHNAFDMIQLQHEALPEGQFDAVDLSVSRFGRVVPTPFFVSSMTAGHQHAPMINRALMEACSASNWAMGVGSQRRTLTDALDIDQWVALKKAYPDVSLMSNLGIAQLIHTPLDKIQQLIDVIGATAFIVHCNPLQECIQPEGTPFFKGAQHALETLAKTLSIPVIVKETGCGFSAKTMRRLDQIGVAAIDVSGLGGTHWGRIEGARTEKQSLSANTAPLFKHWGITTVDCLKTAATLNLSCEIWASGGIRHGLDAAKALALGASSVGFAQSLLEAAMHGDGEAVFNRMQAIAHACRIAMFCTGSFEVAQLKDAL